MAIPMGPRLARAMETPAAQQAAGNVITIRSLLEEMVDRDSVARWPAPMFTVRQTSSYDRHRTGPNEPGWFENTDHSNYIRTETHQGREERVMLDTEGPGAIVRIFRTNAGSKNARVRVYLDGAETPTIEWTNQNMVEGGVDVGAPLRAQHPPPLDHGGATLYLPIPYAKHCKVTLEEREPEVKSARYYHINYRTYAPDTPVKTFTHADLAASRAIVDRVNRELAAPTAPATSQNTAMERTLVPGQEATLDLPFGTFAVRQLEISVGANLSPAERDQALRSVVLRATFDDEPEGIWCPVGDFAGSGAGGHPLQSWYRTVDGKGNSVCRWTMPYRSHARFTLQNLGDKSVPVKLTARLAPWTWDDRSLYFHCDWRQQVQIPARPYRDWNFDTMTGRGVLVGDVMSVFNPLASWYGEGNEKIWVDGESFPSHLGTGTEDYYNASWAPNPVYQTPFANQPRIDDALSQGHNVFTRTRNLDTIPFEKSLQFDFEVMTWRDSKVDYAATTYWYGAPGARTRLQPDPLEARRLLPTLPPRMHYAGAIECESLPVAAISPGTRVETQDMRWFEGGTFSGYAQLLFVASKTGDFVELDIPTKGTTPRQVTLYATQAYDFGIVKFSVNGQPVRDTFDGFVPAPSLLSRPVSLGVFTPVDGKMRLRIELVGTNPQSGGVRYLSAFDAVILSE